MFEFTVVINERFFDTKQAGIESSKVKFSAVVASGVNIFFILQQISPIKAIVFNNSKYGIVVATKDQTTYL